MSNEQNARRLREAGEYHASHRDWPNAKRSFGALRALQPDDPWPLIQLSYVESLQGQYRSAREYALAAGRLVTGDVPALGELLARLRTFNACEELHAVISRIGHVHDLPIPTLLTCAAQLSYLNEHHKALSFLDEAKAADPHYPSSRLARAQVLMYLGRLEESRSEALHVARVAPQIPRSWWLLSHLNKSTVDPDCSQSIMHEMRKPDHRAMEAAELGEALHREHDRFGRYPEAWSALETANSARRSQIEYRKEDTEELVSEIIAADRAACVVPKGEWRMASHVPIFIVGMHRSGTSLLEQILDGHESISGLGELYDFTSAMRYATDHHCRGVIDTTVVRRSRQIDFSDVGKRYMDGLRWRLGTETHFTDKLPSNFFNVGYICRALPHSRILHMVRDPVETCFSNLRENFSGANPYSYEQAELAHFHGQYKKLMQYFSSRYADMILDVDYSRLTRDPATVVKEVAEFCGVAYEPRMLDLRSRSRSVGTASAVQVRQDVMRRERPRWVPYEQYLKPLIDALKANEKSVS